MGRLRNRDLQVRTGAPLGAADLAGAKAFYGLDPAASFKLMTMLRKETLRLRLRKNS
jgi:hypothetical protein